MSQAGVITDGEISLMCIDPPFGNLPVVVIERVWTPHLKLLGDYQLNPANFEPSTCLVQHGMEDFHEIVPA